MLPSSWIITLVFTKLGHALFVNCELSTSSDMRRTLAKANCLPSVTHSMDEFVPTTLAAEDALMPPWTYRLTTSPITELIMLTTITRYPASRNALTMWMIRSVLPAPKLPVTIVFFRS
jgi:hypothetical protein